VIAYFLAVALCLHAAWRSAGSNRRIWTAVSVILALLGVNKQLDLQSLLTQIGRDLARDEGWYEFRQRVQATFLVLLALATAGTAVMAIRICRGRGPAVAVGAIGMIFLLAFIFARALSFHAGDRLIRYELAGLRLNWILELGGIALIALGARMAAHRR
jgi:hypothetical protein